MTTTEFLRRREWGSIQPDARVRTLIWCFAGRPEWVEVFVDERYETIEQQEAAFRRALSPLAQFLTKAPEAGEVTPTILAKHWLAI